MNWGRRRKTTGGSDNRRYSLDASALFGRASLGNFRTSESSRPLTPLQDDHVPPKTSPAPTPRQTPRPSHDVPRSHRFSLLRFRTASDPALGAKARAQSDAPPVPDVPTVITTSPTFDINNQSTPSIAQLVAEEAEQGSQTPRRMGSISGVNLASASAPSITPLGSTTTSPPPPLPSGIARLSSEDLPHRSALVKSNHLHGGSSSNNASKSVPSLSMKTSRVTFDEPERPSQSETASPSHPSPPPYDEHTGACLPLPGSRLSESSRSTLSSGDVAYTTTTTTTQTTTTTTFFRFARRKKNAPLFPLPPKPKVSMDGGRPSYSDADLSRSSAARASMASRPRSSVNISTPTTPQATPNDSHSQLGVFNATGALAASALGFTSPAVPLLRSDSAASVRSARSTPGGTQSSPAPSRLRPRSQTMTSLEPALTVNGNGSTGGDSIGRNSIVGRTSLGGLFARVRQNSEPPFLPFSSRTSSPHPYGRHSGSLPNSSAVSREKLIIPERHDEDTPDRYLARLEEAVSKSVIASLLSRTDDAFHVQVLRRYLQTFRFYKDPMDMALRKLLMEVELPRETQQIDRVLQGFADRYHECNPGIYESSTQAYFIAFSLLILHTDVYNKNNKHKMQKPDYVRNTGGEGVTNDILEYFYDNISYTPFIHVEDDLDINGDKIVPHRPKRGVFGKHGPPDPKKLKEPVDPYTYILEDKLDWLRPKLEDVIDVDDPYGYLGTANSLDMEGLHKSFFRSAVLQIVSARSRPDAFLNPTTVDNPEEAKPGVVEIKVTKIGILWRKDVKKKKTRSPWQEWGAILTGSQLYFFRNVGWVKNLLWQYEQHVKAGNSFIPCVFTPAVVDFSPDAVLSTDDTVALHDSSYKRHKNAFLFVRHGGLQEYFLADSESEMNDWLAKLNYASAFRTAGVRMRGVVGGNYDGQRSRVIRRLGSGGAAVKSIQTPSGEVSIMSGRIDPQLAAQIASARRQVIDRKLAESRERQESADKQLAAYLRNAAHLKILTPVQARTRDAIILSAGALNAKLKWLRQELWKLRCHQDILVLDLDEERKLAKDKLQRNLSVAAPSGTPKRSPKSPAASSPSSAGTTPTQATVNAASLAASLGANVASLGILGNSSNEGNGDGLSRASSQISRKTGGSWELPPLPFQVTRGLTHTGVMGSSSGDLVHEPFDLESAVLLDGALQRRNSATPTQTSIPRTSSSHRGEDWEIQFDHSRRESQASNIRESSKGKGREENMGYELTKTTTPPEKWDNTPPETPTKDKESDAKRLRRSLQRTLRDSANPLNHRSRKSREVTEHRGGDDEDGASRDRDAEGLTRGSGSFTVHGKKASVITFGSEWHTMSPEDRLRRHRSGAGSTITDRFSTGTADRIEASNLGKVLVMLDRKENGNDDDEGEEYHDAAGGYSPKDMTPSNRSDTDGKSEATQSGSGRLIVVNPDSSDHDESGSGNISNYATPTAGDFDRGSMTLHFSGEGPEKVIQSVSKEHLPDTTEDTPSGRRDSDISVADATVVHVDNEEKQEEQLVVVVGEKEKGKETGLQKPSSTGNLKADKDNNQPKTTTFEA